MLTFTDTYTYTPRYQELDFWQEDQLLFDIETTGLSAKYNTIYLIGCAYHKGSEITLLQYLAETPAEESEVLEAFLELCKDFQGLLSFIPAYWCSSNTYRCCWRCCIKRTEDRRGRWLCVISNLLICFRNGQGDRA